MPAAAILVTSRLETAEDADHEAQDVLIRAPPDVRGPRAAPHADHVRQSVLHPVFLPDVEQAWLADPRRRGPLQAQAASREAGRRTQR